jgi:hypothetical protein
MNTVPSEKFGEKIDMVLASCCKVLAETARYGGPVSITLSLRKECFIKRIYPWLLPYPFEVTIK